MFGYSSPMRSGQTTRGTLLQRVRQGADSDAWRELDAAYREMLLRFCRSRGLQHADAEDVIQMVFSRLISGLRAFEYDRSRGRFRDYLFRCVRSAISDWARCQEPRHSGVLLAEAESPEPAPSWSRAFENEWIDHHYRTALSAIAADVEESSLRVISATLAGRTVKEIAGSTGMSEMAVYQVRHRMKERLRARIAEQIAEEERRHEG